MRLVFLLPLVNSHFSSKVSFSDARRISDKKWSLVCGGKYVATWEGKRMIYLHRYLLGLTDPSVKTDHKDRDGLNNCRWNLRRSTNAQNCRNRARKGRSKYRGVTAAKNKTNPWKAQITKNYRLITLGEYASEEAAATAYNEAARKYHGKFASLNEIVGVHLVRKNKRKKSSRFKGVTWNRLSGKWRAYFKRGSTQVHVGLFNSERKAAKAVSSYYV